MQSLPKTVVELIEEMDVLYPPLTPDQVLKHFKSNDQQAVIERAAVRAVIDKLKLRLEKQHGG